MEKAATKDIDNISATSYELECLLHHRFLERIISTLLNFRRIPSAAPIESNLVKIWYQVTVGIASII